MAFKAGNNARKKESSQDSVADNIKVPSIDKVIDEFHHVVGEFTHDIRQSIRDRVNAAVLLYIVESDKKKLTKELLNNKALESTKKKKEESSSYSDTPYWDTLVNKIKNMENSNESILPLLKYNPNYCFNPIIRKIFAGDITDFVAYPYPVNCGLKLTKDEKELLIEINNFKCSFMEETMGNLYLSTKIILKDEDEGTYPDDINKLFKIKNEEIPEKDREKMSYKEIIGKTDRLGFYTTHSYKNSNKEEYVEPEVWLLINKIRRIESLKKLHPYILAKVYIHEMMHRYYDMHPELLLKKSVKEIEEPMAELATIEFCREFCKEHKEYSELVDVAIKHINNLRKTKYYFYALGADLYELNNEEEKRHSLIDIYRHVCMMLHEQNDEVKDYLKLVQDPEKIEAYKKEDSDITKQFCEALINC